MRPPINIQKFESLMRVTFHVLDKGFVRVIDYMGNEDAIVQAARVSYGKGTKSTSKDAALLRYLMRHKHTSPFEMCLSGETLIPTYPCKGAAVKTYSIKKIAEAFSSGGKANSWVKLLKIRTVNPETRVVTSTKIKNAWKTGVKKVYKVSTGSVFNRSITVTDNHPFLTPNGFKSLNEGLKEGDQIMLNGVPALDTDIIKELERRRDKGETLEQVANALNISKSTVYNYSPKRVARKKGFLKKPEGNHADPRAIARRVLKSRKGECYVNGCNEHARDIHHIDQNPHNNDKNNLVEVCPKHHRYIHNMGVLEKCFPEKIEKIEYVGEQEVYDLEVYDDNHTFVANGIVVHNCEVKFHIKAPISVARQWLRHRTASVNEISARYSEVENEVYYPETIRMQDKVNKQSSVESGKPFSEQEEASVLMRNGNALYVNPQNAQDIDTTTFDWYEKNIEAGMAREQARGRLPLDTYTEFYWKIDLHNLLHFLNLRMKENAQYEIRQYANQMGKFVEQWMPNVWQAFLDYTHHSHTFSQKEIDILRQCVDKDFLKSALNGVEGMSDREKRTMKEKLCL